MDVCQADDNPVGDSVEDRNNISSGASSSSLSEEGINTTDKDISGAKSPATLKSAAERYIRLLCTDW